MPPVDRPKHEHYDYVVIGGGSGGSGTSVSNVDSIDDKKETKIARIEASRVIREEGGLH
jgi:pyruvate/2-oxoglutarate dehydrogenase complex dihydrolipoamide dehydrogenase (E3) component